MPVSGCPFSRAGITDPGYSSSVPDFDLDKPPRFFRNFRPMKTTIRLFFALLALFSLFAAGREAQAVVPPPDGGYAGFNTAEGQNALFNLTTGAANTAVGWFSLFSDTEGSFNTATGAGALLSNTADENTAFGAAALLFNITGFRNTAVGVNALANNTGVTVEIPNGDPGSFNTAVGHNALSSNTLGSGNTALGASALLNSATGNNNIAVGPGAGFNVTAANNVICIGATGLNVNNSCFIGNIYSNVQPIVGTDPDSVTITSSGRLGRGNVSSRRYKHDIKPMDKTSEALYALKPVSFRYNKQYDASQTLAFGLIAEEVAEVAPDLVGRNPEGEPESVRYEQINAMLLNEFIKEHSKVEKLEATVADLARQLQKVTAQVELSRPATNIADTSR
jgi:hypothetical protein